MKIRELLQEALVQYVKDIKKIEGKDDKAILNKVKQMQINPTKYSRFSAFENITGLKRAKFLICKLDDWNDSNLSDKKILTEICKLYQSHSEPPDGLGNSNTDNLRSYLEKYILMDQFGIKSKPITDEEMNRMRNRLSYGDDVVGDYTPSDEYVIKHIRDDQLQEAIDEFLTPLSKGFWLHVSFVKEFEEETRSSQLRVKNTYP